jgi:hypothetical protein
MAEAGLMEEVVCMMDRSLWVWPKSRMASATAA